MNSYNLELNKEHSNLLVRALDLYSRVLMGQYEEVENIIRWYSVNKEDFPKEGLDKLRDCLIEGKKAMGHPSNGSHGIHSDKIHDDARKCYDIQQVIRHIVAWGEMGKDPNKDERDFKEMFGVSFDTPLKSSTDDKYIMPKMEKNNVSIQ